MSDKLHFDDLTKITCEISMLDDCTRSRLQQCGSVEYWYEEYWRPWTLHKDQLRGTFRKKHEPEVTRSSGQCYAIDHMYYRPTLSDSCTVGSYLGKYMVTRVDGKLNSITWEAI